MRLTALRHEIVVGWFMAATLVLFAAGVAVKARSGLLGARRFWITVPHGQGLEPGAPVLVRGIHVGETGAMAFTPDGRVRFSCLIAGEYVAVVRKDAVATIAAPPVLGTTKVQIDPGVADEPAAPEQELRTREERSLLDRVGGLEGRVEAVLGQIEGVAAATSEALGDVRRLVARVERGDGLAARLVSDPKLADDVAAAASGVRSVTDRVDQDLMDRFARTLDDVRARLDEGRELMAELRSPDGRLQTLLKDADEAILEARKVLEKAKVDETTAAVRTTLDRVGGSAEGVAESAKRVTPTAEDARAAFDALRRASEALASVARELSRQPNAVIFGREPGMSR